MSIILTLFFIIFLYGAKIAPKGKFFSDYMSLESSNSIKGIFVIFVFFRHYAQYVTLDSSWDKIFVVINILLGQMIVVAFLFYSGYGLMKSIQSKGMDYLKSIPLQRALRVWLHYAIAVCLFLIAQLSMGRHITLKKFLGTLVCWDAIGNSTWYILAVVIAYLLTYISFRFCMENHRLAAAILTILTVVTICVLIPVRPGRYYNTLLVFPLGVWWAIGQEKIDGFLEKKWSYSLSLILCMLVTVITNSMRNHNVWIYEIAAISFACVGILITKKLSLNNRFIQYAGNHVFSIYILQRLPMLILSKLTAMEESPYAFFIVTFVITIIISYIFDWLIAKLDDVIFERKVVNRG